MNQRSPKQPKIESKPAEKDTMKLPTHFGKNLLERIYENRIPEKSQKHTKRTKTPKKDGKNSIFH